MSKAWISLRMEQDDLNALLQDCKEKGVKKSTWIRGAIKEKLEGNKEEKTNAGQTQSY